jgi:dolichol kinase
MHKIVKTVKATATEWPRLLFHIGSGISIVLIYGLTSISRPSGVLILGMITLFFVIGDFFRQRHAGTSNLARKIFGVLMRPEEAKRLGGTTYYVVGCWVAVLAFSRVIACMAVLFLVFGDSAARMVGKRFSQGKIGTKSLAGTLANFSVCFFIGLAVFKMTLQPHPWLVSSIGALGATLGELIPRVDNLTVPILSGLLLTMGMHLIH